MCHDARRILSVESCYLQYQLEFFHACAPRELWANEPERQTRKPDLPTLASEIVRFQPIKDALATAIPPLHAARSRPSLSGRFMRKLQGMARVLAWVLDLSDVSVDEVFEFAQTAPPAVYALIREFAPVSNCKTLVWHASTELRLYLTNLRHPTPHESAALTLLDWLAQCGLERHIDRSHLFFAFPDGSRRIGRSGEKPWEWWFARAARGASCDASRLDAWEKETLEREDWPV
ncbi:uncharacterized protein JCM10292_007716 [Rhodotorula paludigena]|uniref:uncharacterized protein n=1 Tax=Rhodotorula paludigena TaxID=86838 RepID=UPI00316F5618